MGKTGMTSFYYWEYAAPLHKDHDDAWSIASQLWKNVKTDEYNFAYALWGHIIQTEENCIWYVEHDCTFLALRQKILPGFSIPTICMALSFQMSHPDYQ
jgi:hypothetical protein